MAGNRVRQRAFYIPILLEVLVEGGKIDASRWGREKSEGISQLIEWVLSYFKFSVSERKERHQHSKQLVLENDVRWSADQLEEAGYLTRAKNDHWTITDAGIERLRDYFTSLMRRKSMRTEVDNLAVERDCDGQELVLRAVKSLAKCSLRMPTDALSAIVISSDSLGHLFRNAIANLPTSELGDFLLGGYEQFKPLIARDLAERFSLRAAV